MRIYEYFIENYQLLDAENEDQKIESFMEDIEEGEQQRYCEPLKAVFLHETRNEMFLVLDCFHYEWTSIEKICEKWEKKVLNFVNFDSAFRENIEVLKYNILLLILCKDEPSSRDDDIRYDKEKSVTICRKIFLLCNDKGEIYDGEKTIIPFYFEPIRSIKNEETSKLEKELQDILPREVEIQEICKKSSLEPEDIEKIYRWLDKNDNN